MVHQGTTNQTLTSAIRLSSAVAAMALSIGGLVSAQTAMAQGAEPTCNPASDDNDRLYCVWLVEPCFGGMSADQSDASVLHVLLTGDDPTDPAVDRVLGEVNRVWDRDFTGTTVATADYTVGQLKGWFDTAAADGTLWQSLRFSHGRRQRLQPARLPASHAMRHNFTRRHAGNLPLVRKTYPETGSP